MGVYRNAAAKKAAIKDIKVKVKHVKKDQGKVETESSSKGK